MKLLNEKNADLLAQTKVLQDQLKVRHVVIDTHTECQAQYAKLEEERYEYMFRYSALCDNDKQHRKKINEQEILFDKMSRQLVEMNNNVLRLQEKILEKETKILELEGCVSNKDVEIKKCLERLNECENKLHKIGQINQTIHMIIPSKDTLYNGRKGIGFKNPSYFEKAKDLRPSLYDEKQTSSLKPYVPAMILEKIIIDLEYEVVSLLEKEKANLKTIDSLKSKGFELSENAISKSENQSEKECDQVENSKVIAPGMIKLNTFSSVRRPKHSGVIWKKKGSSNTSNVDLSSISHSKLNKDVKRYSRKDLLSCNNYHLGETSSTYVCNDAMNVSCNSRLCDLFDENNLFIFDDESARISPVSKIPLRKKICDSMNVHSKINLCEVSVLYELCKKSGSSIIDDGLIHKNAFPRDVVVLVVYAAEVVDVESAEDWRWYMDWRPYICGSLNSEATRFVLCIRGIWMLMLLHIRSNTHRTLALSCVWENDHSCSIF
uniref:Integrase, catalytic region, zinc finger, CCHC-type, peptidase aspartic, catalytic n=1 Tax=Tanacetum cinerariifolium TaxID=118510 RepID=A0A6L2KA45_TANCI|nr:hypothetical protein [Tanacetum cinerariifolium]